MALRELLATAWAKAGRSGGGPGERFRRDAQYRAGEGGFGRPLAIRLTAADEEDLAQISAYIAIEVSETVAAQFVAAFEPVRYADFALCALID